MSVTVFEKKPYYSGGIGRREVKIVGEDARADMQAQCQQNPQTGEMMPWRWSHCTLSSQYVAPHRLDDFFEVVEAMQAVVEAGVDPGSYAHAVDPDAPAPAEDDPEYEVDEGIIEVDSDD